MLSGGTAETLQCDSSLLHGMRSVCAMPFVRTGLGVAAVGPPKRGGGRPASALSLGFKGFRVQDLGFRV